MRLIWLLVPIMALVISCVPPPPLSEGQRDCPGDYANEVTRLVDISRGTNEGLITVWELEALSARAHNISMAQRDTMDHLNWQQEIDDTGYKYHMIGQIIARGYTTPNDVVNGWLQSPPHHDTIMNVSYKYTGVSCIIDKNEVWWWTQNFAG